MFSIDDVKIINKNLNGFYGVVWLIEIDERFFAVSAANTPDNGPETMIFECNEVGKVSDWLDLVVVNEENHELAIDYLIEYINENE